MKKSPRETIIVDDNHRIRSVRLYPLSQQFKAVIEKAPINWRLLTKYMLAGLLAGALLAWLW